MNVTDVLSILNWLIDHFGIVGLIFVFYGPVIGIGAYLFWNRVIMPWQKKKNNVFVTWTSMDEKLKQLVRDKSDIKNEVAQLSRLISNLTQKDMATDAILDAIQIRQETVEGQVQSANHLLQRVDNSLTTLNKLVGPIKDKIDKEIKRGEHS